MRVLVATASRHGGTAEIGRVIGAILADRGLETDVAEPGSIGSIDAYDAVVLGSAVYAGRWLEPARSFVERFGAGLADRPAWLFSSGPIGESAEPGKDAPEGDRLAAALRARGHRVFAGRLEKGDLSLPERLVIAAVRAPAGDFRPWEEVVAWAGEIATALTAKEPAPVAAT
jgi:menaquinone-dependent protoporphyrinogen oxidase